MINFTWQMPSWPHKKYNPQYKRISVKQKIRTMKLLVDIPDNEAAFGMKVLKSLSFVKKVKPMTDSAVDLWEDLNEAAQEVRLHKQGKIKLKTAQELIDEL
jgi:hypothetical protein